MSAIISIPGRFRKAVWNESNSSYLRIYRNNRRPNGKIMGKEEVIFTKEECDRITKDVVDGQMLITIDVHGMITHDAWRLIHNTCVLNQHQREDRFTIRVIHGYNGGVAIKKAIWSNPVTSRVQRMQSCAWNPGETSILVA